MRVLLYTDASTQKNYSCWAYKSSLSKEVSYGIVTTTHISAIEVMAIIKGLESIPWEHEVMVITDLKSAATIINSYNKFRKHKSYTKDTLYAKMCNKLCEIIRNREVIAMWVPSRCVNPTHLEVDNISRVKLYEFLNKGK